MIRELREIGRADVRSKARLAEHQRLRGPVRPHARPYAKAGIAKLCSTRPRPSPRHPLRDIEGRRRYADTNISSACAKAIGAAFAEWIAMRTGLSSRRSRTGGR